MSAKGMKQFEKIAKQLPRYARYAPKRYQLFILITAFIGLLLFGWQQGWFASIDSKALLHYEPGSYAVARFLDGDTIVVDMQGTEETIRFIGMDTPETHKPNSPVQCYGPAASVYTKQRIGDQRVRLVSDELTTDRDRYNRLLRYVVLEDGTTLNLELVQKGYAFAYSFPFSRSAEFFAAMDQARSADVGLWGNCAPYQSSTGQWHTEDLTD